MFQRSIFPRPAPASRPSHTHRLQDGRRALPEVPPLFADPARLAAALERLAISQAEREALRLLYTTPQGFPVEVDEENRPQGPTIAHCTALGKRLSLALGTGPRHGMSWFGYAREGRTGLRWVMKPQMREVLQHLGWFEQAAPPLPAPNSPDERAPDADPVLQAHLRHEAALAPALVRAKLAAAAGPDGALCCDACGADARRAYPGLPGDLWEVHGRAAAADGDAASGSLASLAVLCPSCHQAIHRVQPMPPVEVFRRWLQRARR